MHEALGLFPSTKEKITGKVMFPINCSAQSPTQKKKLPLTFAIQNGSFVVFEK
jgi:hypothetical protein